MSGHRELINQFISSSDPSIQSPIVIELSDYLKFNKLSLLDLIQSLQIYITSTNDNIRLSSFNLLSQILNNLPLTKLFPNDIDVLLNFLFSKLLDIYVIQYVLSSIYSLINMKYFNNIDNIDKIFIQFIDNFNPKLHSQSIRLSALKIVNILINPNNIHNFSNDLAIDCFLKISINEKDPNNLLLIFQILQKISKNLSIDNFIEPLFDTMFRYYPISFKSSNDLQNVKISSLKDSLNNSLSSNNLYANDLFPNLIEKFNSSSSINVKIDILNTLSIVSKNYSIDIIHNHFLLIWNTIKYNILNQELINLISIDNILSYYENSSNESDNLFYHSLITINSLSKNLSYDDKLLIYDDLSKNLTFSNNNSKFLQSYLILSLISDSNNEQDSQAILSKSLNSLFSNEYNETKNKRSLLIALSYFKSFNNHLIPFKDEIFTILQISLSSSNLEISLQILAIQLIIELILNNNDNDNNNEIQLFNEETDLLISKLGENLLNNALNNSIDFNKLLETELINAIVKISKKSNFENDTINIINNLLSNILKNEINLKQQCILIDYIILFSSTNSLIEKSSLRLINLLNSPTNNIPIELLLNSLVSLFNKLPITYNTDSISNKFIPILLTFLNTNNDDNLLIHYIGKILRRFTISMSNENAERLIIQLINQFHKLLSIDEIPIENNDLNITTPDINHLPLLLLTIQGLDNDIKIPNFKEITIKLSELINNESNGLTKLQLLIGITVIINKYFNWNDYCEVFRGEINNEIKIWSLLGLILKGDSKSIELLFEILNQLTFKQVLKTISIIFTLINDDENNEKDINESLISIYRKQKSTLMIRNNNKLTISNLIIRNIWKQKVLEICLQRKDYNEIILPLILTYLPEELYKSHLKDLLPGLINTITTNKDSNIINSITIIINNILNEQSDLSKLLIKPYIETIINNCIKIIENYNNKEIKINSLKCLKLMTIFEIPLIIPYKRIVINIGNSMLSDKSRDVRMNAVSVIQSWESL